MVFDAADPHALAAFWADAIHYEHEYIDAFVNGLVHAGHVPVDYTIEVDGRRRWRSVASLRHPDDPVGPLDPGAARPLCSVLLVAAAATVALSRDQAAGFPWERSGGKKRRIAPLLAARSSPPASPQSSDSSKRAHALREVALARCCDGPAHDPPVSHPRPGDVGRARRRRRRLRRRVVR